MIIMNHHPTHVSNPQHSYQTIFISFDPATLCMKINKTSTGKKIRTRYHIHQTLTQETCHFIENIRWGIKLYTFTTQLSTIKSCPRLDIFIIFIKQQTCLCVSLPGYVPTKGDSRWRCHTPLTESCHSNAGHLNPNNSAAFKVNVEHASTLLIINT